MAQPKVIALCGFLGAGKTTLLSHLLTNCPQGLRIGVIANDVAAVNIDAQLVESVQQGSDGTVKSVQLDNGCACCTGSEGLAEAFDGLLQGAGSSTFDYVVIEATGVAEAGQMRTVIEELNAVKAGDATLGAIVGVLDARDFLAQYQTAETLGQRPDLTGDSDPGLKRLVVDLLVEQVENADLLVVNKIDLLESDASQLDALDAIVAGLNPGAEVVRTSFGKVDLLELAKEAQPAARHGTGTDHVHGSDHDHKHDCAARDESGEEKHCGCAQHKPKPADHKSRFGIDSFVFSSKVPFHGPALAQNVLKKMAAVQQSASMPAFAGLGSSCDASESKEDLVKNPFAQVIRSKGFMFLGGPQASRKMYWSHAGRHFGVMPKGEWDNETPRQELVFIGINMDKAAITAALESALQPAS